jgi:hypothetical protein
MAKHDDEKITVSVVPPTVDVPGLLRMVQASLDDHQLAVIKRAISLKRAIRGDVGLDDRGRDGSALAAICAEWWLTAESARLSGKGG